MKISESGIDLPGFIAWAAYNDELEDGEKRHTLNYILDQEQRAQAAILEICGAHGPSCLNLRASGRHALPAIQRQCNSSPGPT